MLLTEFNQELYEKTIRQESHDEGVLEGIKIGKTKGIEIGKTEGIEIGESKIMRKMARLSEELKERGRASEIFKAFGNENIRNKLFDEFEIE